MDKKVCTKCKVEKTISEFGKQTLAKDGIRSECKKCHNLRSHENYLKTKDRHRQKSREWAQNNKETVRFYYVKRTYGISKDDWHVILAKQNNKCAICDTYSDDKGFFHTDHCHISKKIRGLLCINCNTILGHSKDNIKILENAINYLKTNTK